MAADRGRVRRRARRAPPRLAWALLAAASGAAAAAPAEPLRFEDCVACHHAPADERAPDVPALGGQTELYALYQLFYFREGRRKAEPMRSLMKGVDDAELKRLAGLIASLPPPPREAGPVDPASFERGRALAERLRCGSCHQPDYSGRKHVPRLAGQREGYLVKALGDFRAGRRIGVQAAMAETLSGTDERDLADLAHYLSRYDG